MNNGMRIFALIGMSACLGLSIVACSKEEPPTPAVKDTGRPETRSIEAADAIGYNGKAIRQKLDKTLNANDATTKNIDQSVDQQQGQ